MCAQPIGNWERRKEKSERGERNDKSTLIEEFFHKLYSQLKTCSSESSKSSVSQYQDEVFQLLHERKAAFPLTQQELFVQDKMQ